MHSIVALPFVARSVTRAGWIAWLAIAGTIGLGTLLVAEASAAEGSAAAPKPAAAQAKSPAASSAETDQEVDQGATTGVPWRQISFDDALKEAAETNQLILVDVWARHCGECGQQDIDVWQTEAGARLAEGLIPIKIESTTLEGQSFSRRYPVTGLPAIIFLRPDGTEVDRLEGFMDRGKLLREAEALKQGLDPLPAMEMRLQANPDSMPLAFEILERYLNRRRDAEAESLYANMLRRDPANRTNYPERAMMRLARQAEHVEHDYEKSASYWRDLVEKHPQSSSVGGAVDGVHKCYMMLGKSAEWVDWICPIVEKSPTLPTLNRSAALVALRNGYRSPCFAKAARVAAQLGHPKQKAFMDSIAVVLEGPGK